MLKPGQMMASNTSQTKPGGKVCLDIEVNLKTDHVEAEDDTRPLPRNSLI